MPGNSSDMIYRSSTSLTAEATGLALTQENNFKVENLVVIGFLLIFYKLLTPITTATEARLALVFPSISSAVVGKKLQFSLSPKLIRLILSFG